MLVRIILSFMILFAAPAGAAPLPIDIPDAAVPRLTALCDTLKTKFPTWTNKDCGLYFLILGASQYNASRQLAIARAALNASLKADRDAFDADFPLPTPIPTATPTATSTGTPTTTPTATPTPIP